MREWTRRPGFSGRELLWFPDPIGGRDCYRAALVDPLLLAPHFVDADRTVLNTRLSLARIDGERLISTVILLKALGGGWK